MTDPYPRGGWDSDRERWPLYPADGAWNQSWDQAPYSDYRGGHPPPFDDWQPPVTARRPRSIQAAVLLMCVGAGLFALSIVANLIGNHWFASYSGIPLNHGVPGLVDVAGAVSGIGSVIGAIVGIALWLWLAWATSAAQSLARTASIVIFLMDTLSAAAFLFTLRLQWPLIAGPRPLSTPMLDLLVSALVFWVLRLTIVVLLYTTGSSAYFKANTASW